MITSENFARRLIDVKDVSQHYAFITTLIENDDAESLSNVFHDVWDQCPFGSANWQSRAIGERIIECLSMKDGFRFAKEALELSAKWQERSKASFSRFNDRLVASLIVSGQSSNTIHKLIDQQKDLEVRALLLQEAVISGKLIADSRSTTETLECLKHTNHELAFLPPTLFDFESKLDVRKYAMGSSSVGSSYDYKSTKLKDSDIKPGNSLVVTETTNEERAKRIQTAVENWETDSNGQIEARYFHLPEMTGELTIGHMASIVSKLGLESLDRFNNGFFQFNAPLNRVFQSLFSAAANGGAYNDGVHNAYGRRFAWHSLCGLTGSSATSSIDEVAQVAKSCQWIRFVTDNQWFYHVAWDFGIGCYNPEHKELAILAATDTD